MDGLTPATIVAIITAVASLIGSIVVWRRYAPEAAKMRAEAGKLSAETHAVRADVADQITETAMSLIAPLKNEIDQLRHALMDRENELLRVKVDLDQALAKLHAAEVGRAERDRRIESLTCRVVDLEAAGAEKDRQVAGYLARIRELEAEIIELRQQIAVLTAELAAAKGGINAHG